MMMSILLAGLPDQRSGDLVGFGACGAKEKTGKRKRMGSSVLNGDSASSRAALVLGLEDPVAVFISDISFASHGKGSPEGTFPVGVGKISCGKVSRGEAAIVGNTVVTCSKVSIKGAAAPQGEVAVESTAVVRSGKVSIKGAAAPCCEVAVVGTAIVPCGEVSIKYAAAP